MNKSMLVGLIVGAVAVTAGGALAGYKMWGQKYAEVVRVEPHMETVRTPREECRDVEVTHQAPVKDEKRVAGTAIGAVVGAVIGNQVGGGSGKTIAKVGGAAAGGYAGNQIQKRVQQNNTVTAVEKQCDTVYDKRERQDGYQVTYRLDGREQTIHMDHDPGSRIPVRDGQLALAD